MGMGNYKRITDPRQVRVQLNISIPFWKREKLHKMSRRERTSMNQLIVDLIDERLDRDKQVQPEEPDPAYTHYPPTPLTHEPSAELGIE